MSTGPITYHLDLPPSMATVHPYFHTRLLKPTGLQPTRPQPSGPPALNDDSYEVIFQINKYGIYARVKYIGYDYSHN